MKISLSKSQWETIGKKAGWTKTAQPPSQQEWEQKARDSYIKSLENFKAKGLNAQQIMERVNGTGFAAGTSKEDYVNFAKQWLAENMPQQTQQTSQVPQTPQRDTNYPH